MAEKFVCPKCGSSDIQRCSVIYQSGTVGHSYTSRSGDYNVETSGTESTALAQSVAPPAKKETHWGGMIVLGLIGAECFIEDFWILGIIFALAAIGLFMGNQEASDYNDKQWPRDYKDWQNSWLCHRCGHYFIMD